MPSTWDSEDWLREYRDATLADDEATVRALRSAVFNSTLEAIRASEYEHQGRRLPLTGAHSPADPAVRSTFYESTDEIRMAGQRRNQHQTRVLVSHCDTLEAAHFLSMEGHVPAILNMANGEVPGGGVRYGAAAQEEELFRRTTLAASLYRYSGLGALYGMGQDTSGVQYPIPENGGGIYSAGVTVFRGPEASGYAFLAQPYEVAVISVPAICCPEVLDLEDGPSLSAPDEALTREKMRSILRIAAAHLHSDLVLGALGCGAFANPASHIAKLFRDVLAEEEFSGAFRFVVFAILDRAARRAASQRISNFAVFESTLAGSC